LASRVADVNVTHVAVTFDTLVASQSPQASSSIVIASAELPIRDGTRPRTSHPQTYAYSAFGVFVATDMRGR
jgi:hypothetical protein